MQSNSQSRFWSLSAWKWITMVILIGVFVAGWYVPLNPGIIKVSPDSVKAGEHIMLDVTGYNSFFTNRSDEIRAWLRLQGDTVLSAERIEVLDDRHLQAHFGVPSVFPLVQEAYPLTLVIDHPADGVSLLPNAVFVTPASDPDSSDLDLWTKEKIDQIHSKAGIQFPYRNILSETIRNTYFHVPMWFAMIILFGISAWYSLKYYRTGDISFDNKSLAFINVGLLFGMMGMITGMLWAKFTWNAYWSWDVKQNMSAIALLIYAAMLVMRSSVEDEMQKARLTAGYNMFAFILLIPLLFIVPRMTDSLHPGNGGNPAFGGEDLDNTMRIVFYPAIIGWTMLGIWVSQLTYRIHKLKVL